MGKIEFDTGRRSEPVVSIPSGAYFTAPQVAPTSKSIMFFASIKQNAALDARTQLFNWGGVGGGFATQFSSGTGLCGLRARIASSAGDSNISAAVPVQIGNKYLILYTGFIQSGTIRSIAYIFDGNSWVAAFDDTESTAGTDLDLGTVPWDFFREKGKTSQYFTGTVNRFAVWLSTSEGPIADITQADVRGAFASRNVSAGPRTSTRLYGTPVIDLNGSASDYQSGVHTGSWASLTHYGTAIGEPTVDESPPTADTTPEIVGDLTAGTTVSVSPAPVDGAEPITDTYTWFVDGVEVATGESYTITVSDEGSDLTVEQFSSNAYGDVTLLSEPYAIPTPSPTDTVRPVIDIATAGSDSGGILPLTVSCTEATSRPVAFKVVVVAANAGEPSVTQVKAGTDAADISAPNGSWSVNPSTKTDAVVLSNSLAAGTYDIYVVATDNAGNDTLAVKLIEDVVVASTVTSLDISTTLTYSTPSPAPSGTLTYSVFGRSGPTGDVIDFIPTDVDDNGDDWEPAYFELRVPDGAGGYLETRSKNATLGQRTILRGLAGVSNNVEVRQVDKKIVLVYCDEIFNSSGGKVTTAAAALAQPGTIIEHRNGSTAQVVSLDMSRKPYLMNITNIEGYFENSHGDDKDIRQQGTGSKIATTNKQQAHYRWPTPETEILEGAWQTPVAVTPTVGTPTVTITTADGRGTFTEGEIVGLKAQAEGFDTDEPLWDCNFKWSVVTAGNSLNYTRMNTDMPWDIDQAVGEGEFWANRPQTTGTVQYQVEVFHHGDKAGSVIQTIDVTITPKATTFTAAETYVVDPDNVFSGAPTASNTYTTLSAALDAITTSASGTVRRLSLRNGKSYTMTADLDFRAGFDKLCIDTYGAGAPAIIDAQEYFDGQGRAQSAQMLFDEPATMVILEGFDLVKPYDSTRPDEMNSRYSEGVNVENVTYTSMYNIGVTGASSCIKPGNPGTYTMMSGTDVYNYAEFGWYANDAGAQYFVGCTNRQPVNAYRSFGKNDAMRPYTVNHAGARNSRNYGERCYYMLDITSTTGWQANNRIQNWVRWFGAMPDTILPIRVTKCRGLSSFITVNKTTSGASDKPTEMVMKKVHFTDMNGDRFMFGTGASGVYLENCMFVTENQRQESDGKFKDGINFGPIDADRKAWMWEMERFPRRIRNCSVINLKAGANTTINSFTAFSENNNPEGEANVLDQTIENVLGHYPGYPSNPVDMGPFDTTSLWTPKYDGYYSYEFTVLTVTGGSGATPKQEQEMTVTGTGGAVHYIKLTQDITGSEWTGGTGTATLLLNADGSGTFTPGETVTFGNGSTATVATFTVGLHDDNPVDTTSAHTVASTAKYAPLIASSPAYNAQDAGSLLPYDDLFDTVRNRVNPTLGAVEAV